MSQTEGTSFTAGEKAPSLEDQQAQQEADMQKPEAVNKSAQLSIIDAFIALPVTERLRLYDDLAKCMHKDADANSMGKDIGSDHYESIKVIYS